MNLSLFKGQLRNASGATPKTLLNEELHTILMYVLTNLVEVEPYIQQVLNKLFPRVLTILHPTPFTSRLYREFTQQFWRRRRVPTPHEVDTLLKSGAGQRAPDFISWFKHKV